MWDVDLVKEYSISYLYDFCTSDLLFITLRYDNYCLYSLVVFIFFIFYLNCFPFTSKHFIFLLSTISPLLVYRVLEEFDHLFSPCVDLYRTFTEP